MGQRANVRADGERFSHSSAEYPGRHGAADWFRRLFVDEPENYSLRRYEQEQWDVMFFVQGRGGDDPARCARGNAGANDALFRRWRQSPRRNNVAVVIPPGVAHAIRVEGSEDVIMVYGTSTSFRPEFEGRIASEVETAALPESWQRFFMTT